MERLEDSCLALGSLSSNRHSAPFRSQLQTWTASLGAVAETLERWLAVQGAWTSMEAVFSGGDIVKQLPAEARRFQVRPGWGVWVGRGLIRGMSKSKSNNSLWFTHRR